MTKTTNLKNNNLTSTPDEVKTKELIKLTGITTSQINQALKAKSPYPARVFLKVDNQEEDIPIFFRIKENNQWIRPKIKKGSYLAVEGYFSASSYQRQSFTAYSYRLLNKSNDRTINSSYQLLNSDPISQKAQTTFNHWAKQRLESYGK